MGAAVSGERGDGPQSACAQQLERVRACKQRVNLPADACYPPEYTGECDGLEHDLKRCMAFALDPDAAAILYDVDRTRQERADANRRLQPLLQRHLPPCVQYGKGGKKGATVYRAGEEGGEQ